MWLDDMQTPLSGTPPTNTQIANILGIQLLIQMSLVATP